MRLINFHLVDLFLSLFFHNLEGVGGNNPQLPVSLVLLIETRKPVVCWNLKIHWPYILKGFPKISALEIAFVI